MLLFFCFYFTALYITGLQNIYHSKKKKQFAQQLHLQSKNALLFIINIDENEKSSSVSTNHEKKVFGLTERAFLNNKSYYMLDM